MVIPFAVVLTSYVPFAPRIAFDCVPVQVYFLSDAAQGEHVLLRCCSYPCKKGEILLSMSETAGLGMPPYEHLRDGFMKFHQNDINIMLHLFTGGLGVIGGCSLVYRFSNRSIGTLSLLLILYIASLAGAVPPELVLVVAIFLSVVAVSVVQVLDLGVVWSVAAVVLAYLGQDMAHYLTGEATFQSTYSGSDAFGSVANATTWIKNFSEHTFFLLPLTVDAAVPLLPDNMLAWFGRGLATPTWLLTLRANVWAIALLAVWVGGCYALDSDSGPFPFMFVKRRMLRCNLGSDSLKADLAEIRRWAMDLKPSKETTTHWWFSDLGKKESEAFTRIATSHKVCTTTICIVVL